MGVWVDLERRKMLTNLVCLKRRNVHCLVSRFTTRYTLTKLQFTVFVNPFKKTCQLFVSDTRPERPLVAHFFLPRGRNRQRKPSLGGQPVSTHFKVNTCFSKLYKTSQTLRAAFGVGYLQIYYRTLTRPWPPPSRFWPPILKVYFSLLWLI